MANFACVCACVRACVCMCRGSGIGGIHRNCWEPGTLSVINQTNYFLQVKECANIKISNLLHLYEQNAFMIATFYRLSYLFLQVRKCHIYPNNSDGQACANSADPDQTPQYAASDLDLHCLPDVQRFDI